MTSAQAGRGGSSPAHLRSLADGRAATRRMAGDLLTHVPDVGDVVTQRLLDAWVEQAADTLLALSDALEERLLARGGATAPDGHIRTRP